MPDRQKIATCCYCGRRQMLRLTARGGHELACGACGAPLHEMKWLKPPSGGAKIKRSPRRVAPHGKAVPPEVSGRGRWQDRRDWPGRDDDDDDDDDWRGRDDPRRRRRKRRTPMWKKVAGEAFDFIDDIFD